MSNLGRPRCIGGPLTILSGSFRPGVTNVTASGVLPVTAAGKDILITSDVVGTGGNTKTFAATADGLAKAACTLAVGAASLAPTRNVGGTAGNGKYVYLLPGGTAGAEVATADGSGNLWVSYQASTSTATQIAAAIHGHADWTCVDPVSAEVATGLVTSTVTSGGTAQEWASETAGAMVLHFVDATTTVALAIAACNAASGKTMTASATGTGVTSNVLAAGDAIVATALPSMNSGVTGVAAVSASESVASDRVAVSKSGAGTYTVTLSDYAKYGTCVFSGAALQIATAENRIEQVTSFSGGVLTISSNSTATPTDVTDGANNRIHWMLVFNK